VRIAPTFLTLAALALSPSSLGVAGAQSIGTWNLFAQNPENDTPQARRPPVTERAPLPRPRPPELQKGDPEVRAWVGQMIILGFPGAARGENWPVRIADMIRQGKIGGTILFSDNIVEPRQVKRLTTSFAPKNGRQIPFICIDQEGGLIQRLTPAKGFIGLPSAEWIGTQAAGPAREAYDRTAKELDGLGINCNFGPVVDLNVEPNNPAIGRLQRSYNRDPQKVISYARLFVEAHHEARILTVAKHFPGHGSARSDPHDQIVSIARWQDRELDPFRALIKSDKGNDTDVVDMIMVGHLIHQRFSDGDKPASLSRKAIQDELRTQLGFRGLIVSDDLDMGAIRARYGIKEAAVMAIEAGSDLIIIANTKAPDPTIADRIADAVSEAVAQGRIDRKAVEQSYHRILQVKTKLAERRAYVLH
jgi:beta-N-acetylhexosaminidase